MNNLVFGKHQDIKFVTTEKRKNYLVSEPIYHTTKFLPNDLIPIKLKKKTQIFINKLVYLGLSMLEISEISMYEF